MYYCDAGARHVMPIQAWRDAASRSFQLRTLTLRDQLPFKRISVGACSFLYVMLNSCERWMSVQFSSRIITR